MNGWMGWVDSVLELLIVSHTRLIACIESLELENSRVQRRSLSCDRRKGNILLFADPIVVT